MGNCIGQIIALFVSYRSFLGRSGNLVRTTPLTWIIILFLWGAAETIFIYNEDNQIIPGKLVMVNHTNPSHCLLFMCF